jgi:hypothetical protein
MPPDRRASAAKAVLLGGCFGWVLGGTVAGVLIFAVLFGTVSWVVNS